MTNATDCIINHNDVPTADAIGKRVVTDVNPATEADAEFRNTGIDWEINNARVCSLENNLSNEYVKHLLKGKGLPITYTTYITQSQSVKGVTEINVQVIPSVSKLVALFITFTKRETQALVMNTVRKNFVASFILNKHRMSKHTEFMTAI